MSRPTRTTAIAVDGVAGYVAGPDGRGAFLADTESGAPRSAHLNHVQLDRVFWHLSEGGDPFLSCGDQIQRGS